MAMLKIEDVIADLENVSNMPGEEMTRNDNDIFIRNTAENAIELLKEQQQGKWIDPVKQPPTPNDSIFGRCYIVRNKNGDVFTLRYARREIRGKCVERWQRDDMSIYQGEIVAYMDMPK